LPPTAKGRNYELKALGLREFAGLQRIEQRLDPFELARYAKLLVASFEPIEPFLSVETKKQLLEGGRDAWSGGACSQALPDGKKLIILNPTHGENRQNATLMEEICHVFLGHNPSRLAVETRNAQGKIIARDYQPDIEEEAYSVGAAALVPFQKDRGVARCAEVRQIRAIPTPSIRNFCLSQSEANLRYSQIVLN